jgi:hypothetical protein
MATRRAVRAFLEHRKARQAGLLLPARTREADAAKCTNELAAAAPGGPCGRAVAALPPPAEAPAPAEPDPDAWLAEVPVVEQDPADEALRRSLLGMVEHEGLRAQAATGTLQQIEQLVVAGDPAAYEEWFARQPKPPFPPMALPDSIKADIAQATRHNPPWLRGEYLSYYRPPVPAHVFAAAAANDPAPETAPAPASPACSTAARRAWPRSSSSRRRSAPSSGRNGPTIAARSTSACCAGRSSASSSTPGRSPGSAAGRSSPSAAQRAPAPAAGDPPPGPRALADRAAGPRLQCGSAWL